MEVIIFCGIQASGKTTFYKDFFLKSHIRISLDQLRTRNKEEKYIQLCLSFNQSFVVDNTNPTINDRGKYINVAKEHKCKIICYYFKSKLNDSLERNKKRIGKENIPEIGVRGTFNKLEIPSFKEGFDELYYVEINENSFTIKEWHNEEIL